MKLLHLTITLLLTSFAFGQSTKDLDKYTIDSVRLSDTNAKKVVAFKYSQVTIYLSYIKCKKAIKESIKNSKWGPKDRNDLLKSLLKQLDKERKQSDTLKLSQAVFDKFQMTPLNAFVAEQIDNGTCIVLDSNNIIHKTIIRIKGSYYKDPLNARGVKLYFLPGQENAFIGTTVWVS